MRGVACRNQQSAVSIQSDGIFTIVIKTVYGYSMQSNLQDG
jgi:hypothetical protein